MLNLNKCQCGKSLRNKPSWIACDKCDQWWHGKCVNLTKQICNIFKDKKLPFVCPTCIVSNLENRNTKVCAEDECEKPKFHINANQEKQTDTVEKHECNKEVRQKNVVIIDGLRKPEEFQNSRDIKAEIRKQKEDLKIKYAYPLNRGGVAVTLESEEEADLLKEDWPVDSFGNSGLSLNVHEKSSIIPRCILKNVSPFTLIDSVIGEIQKQTGVKVSARRLRYRDTNKPMPVVEVTCSSPEDLHVLFKVKVSIADRIVGVKAYVGKTTVPLRCYNCQEFGHVARLCVGESRCEYCGVKHTGRCNGNPVSCVNCGGSYRSSSPNCPAYLSVRERLLSRKLRA